MCDTADQFTFEAALCVDGATTSGWLCTGHAHVGGQHVRCTDASHQPPSPNVITVPATGLTLSTLSTDLGPALYGDLTGQRWTC